MAVIVRYGVFVALSLGAQVETDTRTNTPSSTPVEESVTTSSVDCDPRKCEVIDSPCEKGQICDMYRNQCAAICRGTGCCESVKCPAGSSCIPALGICGVPQGDGCYDLGESWWTGRDIPLTKRATVSSAKSVAIEIYNDRKEPIYLIASQVNQPRFDLSVEYCGENRKLDLPENVFCPTRCAESGLAMEVDCGKPSLTIYCLMPKKRIQLLWSGMERIATKRSCSDHREQICYKDHATLKGEYSLDLCAYTMISGGRKDPNDASRFIGATVVNQPLCKTVRFSYPSERIILIDHWRAR